MTQELILTTTAEQVKHEQSSELVDVCENIEKIIDHLIAADCINEARRLNRIHDAIAALGDEMWSPNFSNSIPSMENILGMMEAPPQPRFTK